jgi:hypothetical protein
LQATFADCLGKAEDIGNSERESDLGGADDVEEGRTHEAEPAVGARNGFEE